MAKHVGVKSQKGFGGVSTVKLRGKEIGRVSPTYRGYTASSHIPGRGYKHIGSFPTHRKAVDAVAKSASHKIRPAVKSPNLKRPKQNSLFKRRTHPTQSLGAF
jgi:hypothetical protein